MGTILENCTTESVMYYFYHFIAVFSFVQYVCHCSVFLETGYEMLRIYMQETILTILLYLHDVAY